MEILSQALGLGEEKLSAAQMGCRAFFVFFIALFYVSIAGLRTLGKKSSFDQITVLIIGALLAKSIVGNEPFFSILFAALLLMILHRLIAWICIKSRKAEYFIKGKPVLLIKDGKPVEHNLKKVHITSPDLYETIRLVLHDDQIEKVKEAYLEVSGEISIIKKEEFQ
jgi:uncharacterized membrane protein YcaP (DUF421 family)